MVLVRPNVSTVREMVNANGVKEKVKHQNLFGVNGVVLVMEQGSVMSALEEELNIVATVMEQVR
ncbi:MAG: hypothetical protein ACRD38_09695 [Nitrososphaerales archaeon]